jgi:predicted DNA-binding transcriptional regulator YafY
VTGIEEISLRALAKLQQVLPPKLRRRVEVIADATVSSPGWTGNPIDPDVLVVIAQACRGSERLRFSYTANDGSTSDRLVEPHRLVSRSRRWYFIAWDVDRDDWRTFRADRVSRPFATGVRVPPRELPAENAAAFLDASLRSRPQQHHAVVRIAVPFGEIRASVPRWMGELSDNGDGTTRLEAAGDSLRWLAVSLTMLEADAEVVDASPGVREQLRVLRDRMSRLAAPA